MWPSHLDQDVRFDHAAAAASAEGLRRLARALEDHATDRTHWLATADFLGAGRQSVDDLTHRHHQRIAALARALHAEAARVEAAASAARRDQAAVERARAAWWRQQQLVG